MDLMFYGFLTGLTSFFSLYVIKNFITTNINGRKNQEFIENIDISNNNDKLLLDNSNLLLDNKLPLLLGNGSIPSPSINFTNTFVKINHNFLDENKIILDLTPKFKNIYNTSINNYVTNNHFDDYIKIIFNINHKAKRLDLLLLHNNDNCLKSMSHIDNISEVYMPLINNVLSQNIETIISLPKDNQFFLWRHIPEFSYSISHSIFPSDVFFFNRNFIVFPQDNTFFITYINNLLEFNTLNLQYYNKLSLKITSNLSSNFNLINFKDYNYNRLNFINKDNINDIINIYKNINYDSINIVKILDIIKDNFIISKNELPHLLELQKKSPEIIPLELKIKFSKIIDENNIMDNINSQIIFIRDNAHLDNLSVNYSELKFNLYKNLEKYKDLDLERLTESYKVILNQLKINPNLLNEIKPHLPLNENQNNILFNSDLNNLLLNNISKYNTSLIDILNKSFQKDRSAIFSFYEYVESQELLYLTYDYMFTNLYSFFNVFS